MSNQSQDFQPLIQYDQSLTKNESWINVTVTKTDPDGSIATARKLRTTINSQSTLLKASNADLS